MSLISSIAGRLGTGEMGLKFIIGMMSAYPVMLVHNLFLKRKPATVQHLYFGITGIVVGYWFLGALCLFNNFACILVTYIVLKVFGGTFATTSFLFVFQLGYLVTGYTMNVSTDYVINWTMPHCVLCLRLIGLAMDVYDGNKPEAELSKDQISSKLPEVPSLLEMISHVFYLGSYFVGPQHSMTRFRNFIARNIEDGDMTGSISFGLRRLSLGWVYIAMHLVGDQLVPQNYVLSEEFNQLPFWKMYLLMTVWTKAILAKYIGAWLFSEGACIFSGLAYNGRKEDGTILWNGGANVRLRLFESCYKFTQMIDSFNINTNAWCMKYVYKRCRFLNSKFYSQMVTMGFLALWHGIHSGYYLTFFNEVLVVNFEKQFFSLMDKIPAVQKINDLPAMNFAFKLIGKLYLLFFLPHCFMPFALLKSSLYIPMLRTTLAPVFLFFGTWPLWKIPLTMLLKPKSTRPAAAKSQVTEVSQPEADVKTTKTE